MLESSVTPAKAGDLAKDLKFLVRSLSGQKFALSALLN